MICACRRSSFSTCLEPAPVGSITGSEECKMRRHGQWHQIAAIDICEREPACSDEIRGGNACRDGGCRHRAARVRPARSGPYPAQGRRGSELRSRRRRLREGGRPDRGQEDRRRAPGYQRRRNRDRRVAHDRAAGLHRHAPSFLSKRVAQRAGERRARGLFPRHFRRRDQSLSSRGRLYRQPDRCVALARCRHHHHHRPVAGLQYPRAQRRLDQGAHGIQASGRSTPIRADRAPAPNGRATSSACRSSISPRPTSW